MLRGKAMKTYNALVGQSRTVEFLRDCRRSLLGCPSYSLSPLMLVGPDGSGKMTLAKLFAQAVRCEKLVNGTDPCGRCEECVGVTENRSFAYIEFESRVHGSYENVWKILNTSSVVDRTVILVRDPELLSAGVGDVLLKSLEESRQRTFIFVASDEVRVSPTIRSRCKIRHMVSQPPDVIQGHLSELCDMRNINYQSEAVALLALAAGGWIGRSRSLLGDVARLGPVTVSNVRLALGLPRDEDVIAFSLALLKDELEEAYRLSEGLGRNGLAAVQSFFRACFVRHSVGSTAKLGSAFASKEIAPTSWQAVDHEWTQLARKRSLSTADCAREAMMYWSAEQSPVRWEAVLVRFQTLLRGHVSAT